VTALLTFGLKARAVWLGYEYRCTETDTEIVEEVVHPVTRAVVITAASRKAP
jgi:hypothetical protein